MIVLRKFSGINNVKPTHRLAASELVSAADVNIGLDGEIVRRDGYMLEAATCHKNLWAGRGFTLASDDADLFKIGGGVVSPAIGPYRIWYCNLPDGRTTFSTGLINGITDGVNTTAWGVPRPESVGFATGGGTKERRWAITYVRTSDGLEGGPAYGGPVQADSGIDLVGLPELEGYSINVYVTPADGEEYFLAGSTTGPSASISLTDDSLTRLLRTNDLYPMPVGTLTAFWRGRVLVAQGPTLYASSVFSWESCDIARDFKQFSADITLIQPVDSGVYVGTQNGLVFLAGNRFDALEYRPISDDPVVLGSGVTVPAEILVPREGSNYRGPAMVCIAGGAVVFGYDNGSTWRVTQNTYRTDLTEAFATWRYVNDIPQYVVLPR